MTRTEENKRRDLKIVREFDRLTVVQKKSLVEATEILRVRYGYATSKSIYDIRRRVKARLGEEARS